MMRVFRDETGADDSELKAQIAGQKKRRPAIHIASRQIRASQGGSQAHEN
jgi:hypothetical protein